MAPNATFLLSLTSSSLPISLFNHNLHTQFRSSHKLFVSFSKAPTFSFTASAATVDKARVVHGGENAEKETFRQPRPTEVYICNLPRSCDVQHLLHLFNPHGTVLSAQVSRSETGESRGSAYVTMTSIDSAKRAIEALDASDVGGREVLVRFSAEMNPKRRNLDTMNSLPMRTIYYEGPHKLYVGNLSKFTMPEDLRQLFGRFGNVTSVRVLQDTRQGKQRVYAFVSYLSERERNAALSLNGALWSNTCD
ncbi:28 kDa ribonucleoprotein, chloroplastic-like isoform X2 [Vigna unguiculata]|uniref:28 kDa ribonucleoprotein, chloroplastic-like isoform X2 n=1 Tax=Vigna unguiculata TaxID=3917 RepID=UPI001015E3F6|nr:28 kDa ribonucleoprotein, chloroplastic-like isoform X2 [Vigna unguiculata]